MLEEEVEALRRLYASFARGDFTAGAELLAPDAEFVTFTSESDDERYEGPDGVRRWTRDFFAQWDHFRIEAEEFRAREDKVLVIGHQSARGRASGVPVEMPVFTVWTFRGGRAVRVHWTRHRHVAFAAAGLDDA